MKAIPLYSYISRRTIVIFLIMLLLIDILIFFTNQYLMNSFIDDYTRMSMISVKNIISEKAINGSEIEKNYSSFLTRKLNKIKDSGYDYPEKINEFINNNILNEVLFTEFGVESINYEIISSEGQVIFTDYKELEKYDYSKDDVLGFWKKLKKIPIGLVVNSAYTYDAVTGKIIKSGYLKLNNSYIVSIIMTINKSVIEGIYKRIIELKNELYYLKDIGVYYVKNQNKKIIVNPVYDKYTKVDKNESDIIIKSFIDNKNIIKDTGNNISFVFPWFRGLEEDDRITDTFIIKCNLDIGNIKTLSYFILGVINITLIIMFFIISIILNKLTKKLINPINMIINKMKEFAKTKFYNFGDEVQKFRISEIENLNHQYSLMADELSAALEEYNATNESLEAAYNEIERSYDYFTKKLVDIVEGYDENTGNHVERVGVLSAFIAEKLGYKDQFIKEIRRFAPLHDIGKIIIPQTILQKKSSLNQEEWDIVKSHTIEGARLLGGDPVFSVGKNIALYHHEKFDGSGYPFGLKGEEIPVESAIVSFVDVYDALRSKRPYKDAFTREKTFEIIFTGDEKTKPEDFNPKVLEIFKQYIKEISELWETL